MSNDILQQEDDIVTLRGSNGEEIDFVEIAGIAYKGKFYAILQPVELLEGIEEDEAFVFEVSRGDNGADRFNVVLDEEIIQVVFDEYYRLIDQYEQNSD